MPARVPPRTLALLAAPLVAALLSCAAARRGTLEGFPRETLVAEPLADPRRPRHVLSWNRYDTDFVRFDAGTAGLGAPFPVVRWTGERVACQLGIEGSALSLFNLDSSELELLNVDFTFGFPLELTLGDWAARLRLYHQSSHLGDEILLDPDELGLPFKKKNLSFETLELYAAYQRERWRVLAGPSYIVRTQTELERLALQAGAEVLPGARPVGFEGGLFVRSWEETDWDVETSARAGVRFSDARGDGRSLSLALVAHDGRLPHGQFFALDASYVGLELTFQR